jgi:hypothetical protein
MGLLGRGISGGQARSISGSGKRTVSGSNTANADADGTLFEALRMVSGSSLAVSAAVLLCL